MIVGIAAGGTVSVCAPGEYIKYHPVHPTWLHFVYPTAAAETLATCSVTTSISIELELPKLLNATKGHHARTCLRLELRGLATKSNTHFMPDPFILLCCETSTIAGHGRDNNETANTCSSY